MKRTGVLFLILVLSVSLCSCRAEKPGALERINTVRESFGESLSKVSVFYSGAEEGSAGYVDDALLSAILGGGEYPSAMSGCFEYAFLCSSEISLCEVWVIECRTYSSAREVYALFEKRKKLLTSPQYENDRDVSAAQGTVLERVGKYVYFVVNEKGADILHYLKHGT